MCGQGGEGARGTSGQQTRKMRASARARDTHKPYFNANASISRPAAPPPAPPTLHTHTPQTPSVVPVQLGKLQEETRCPICFGEFQLGQHSLVDGSTG